MPLSFDSLSQLLQSLHHLFTEGLKPTSQRHFGLFHYFLEQVSWAEDTQSVMLTFHSKSQLPRPEVSHQVRVCSHCIVLCSFQVPVSDKKKVNQRIKSKKTYVLVCSNLCCIVISQSFRVSLVDLSEVCQ